MVSIVSMPNVLNLLSWPYSYKLKTSLNNIEFYYFYCRRHACYGGGHIIIGGHGSGHQTRKKKERRMARNVCILAILIFFGVFCSCFWWISPATVCNLYISAPPFNEIPHCLTTYNNALLWDNNIFSLMYVLVVIWLI